MTALLPALLCALFACWSGTFYGGAGWLGALAGDLAVLVFALAAAPRLRDPLRLGGAGTLLLPALAVVAAASMVTSPVPRAGLERLAILPALLLVPAAIERLWRRPERRVTGWRSLALVGFAVATWSLVDVFVHGSQRAAAPLGHHGALAVWLLLLLPFSALAMRDHGRWRWIGAAAMATGVAALFATRSVVGAVLLLLQASMLLRGRGRAWGLLAAAALGALLLGPRLVALVSVADPSMLARVAYFAAAVDGIRERPGLGWGPGSVGYTIAEHLHAAPGRNPPGEVVSYTHFLPFDLAYQIGVAGALLAAGTVAAFLIARWRERAIADDPRLLEAALASLVAGLAALCLAGFQPLGATVVAAVVAAGAALAASGSRLSETPSASGGRRSEVVTWITVLGYVAIALALLVPVRRAQRLYERARVSERPLALLAAAVDRDGAFPLYAARRSWSLRVDEPAPSQVAAEEALDAAERARGVGALWLAAGLLGVDSGASWSQAALRRACDLDPLGALAPFRLATLEPGGSAAAVTAARALLAEPLLAAAADWQEHADLYARAVVEVTRWPGVDTAWRDGMVAALRALPPASAARTRPFFLEMDARPETSLSLFVFRRLPWRTTLGTVDLDVDRLRRVAQIGSAALRPDTEPWAFARNGCGAAEPPRRDPG